MNIIFGREQADTLKEKYTILELDTFNVNDQIVTAFCAVDNIPIMEMPNVESMKKLHENLLIEFRKKNWNFCNQALEHLLGRWSGQLDTFYDSLRTRIDEYSKQDPGANWDGIIVKV